jgi:AcrR family transcriptional regulator
VPGTPEWWASPHSREPRLALSSERIAATGLRIADAEGLDALSMRRLATELSTGTAQLYRYVTSKDEVLALVVDRMMSEVGGNTRAVSAEPPNGWRSRITAGATALRRTLAAHPNVVPLLAGSVPIGPNALESRERMFSNLLRLGFPPELVVRTYLALMHYVIGFVLLEVGETADPERSTALSSYYRGLPVDEYPMIVELSAMVTEPDVDEKFAFGLGLLLDGLAQQL